MGEVLLGEHRTLSKAVAIKLLHAHLARRPDLVTRLRLEGEALGHLYHPNVVAVFDVGSTPEGRPFLVMEKLEGRTLHAEVDARGSLPVREAVRITIQALSGLAAVHAKGLLHRDVKLDNLFLCEAVPGLPRQVKLLDLGVAKVIASAESGPAMRGVRTDEGVSMGTPRYFSPEQAAFTAVDERSDLYAMGVVLYTLLAGRGPFDHVRTLSEILDAHASAIPAPPSAYAKTRIPPLLDDIVLKALEKRKEHRFATPQAFAEALRAAEATLGGRSDPQVVRRRRPSALVPSLIATLVSVAASAIVTALLHGVLT